MKAGHVVSITSESYENATATATLARPGREKPMNCAEFQRDLPLIIDTGGNPQQEEHLRDCVVCRDLVSDLRYIADQAKLLVPMEDPSPRVWDGIEKKLKLEGLAKPVRIHGAPNQNLYK
jgi:hypothetical protein